MSLNVAWPAWRGQPTLLQSSPPCWWQPGQGAALAGKIRAVVSVFYCWLVMSVAVLYKLRRSLCYSNITWEEHSCKELLHQDKSCASKSLGWPLRSGHWLCWASPLLSSLIHLVVPSKVVPQKRWEKSHSVGYLYNLFVYNNIWHLYIVNVFI